MAESLKMQGTKDWAKWRGKQMWGRRRSRLCTVVQLCCFVRLSVRRQCERTVNDERRSRWADCGKTHRENSFAGHVDYSNALQRKQ